MTRAAGTFEALYNHKWLQGQDYMGTAERVVDLVLHTFYLPPPQYLLHPVQLREVM